MSILFQAREETLRTGRTNSQNGSLAGAQGSPPERRGATVEFRHVTKSYGRAGKNGQGITRVVDDFSLVVPPGEICALVGPSGCGKTTTLKMVNRLVEPSSGQVLIDGADVTTVDVIALRRRIGYVIQQVGLLPHQTITDNVATVPRLLGWPRRRIAERVDELLTLIGLDPAAVRHRYPSQLSGGERQRVGVARALAAEPPLMLMDEPFGAVDPIVRQRLQDEFLHLHRQIGTTILLVTHDVDEALKMGDRIAVMEQGGRLVQSAGPIELLAHPANDFVARFVGADRTLKLLGLLTAADVCLTDVPVVRDGQPLGADPLRRPAGRHRYAVRVDRENRPQGWLDVDPAAEAGTSLSSSSGLPLARLSCETTLRDALPTLLASPLGAGVVVDREGYLLGALSLDTIGKALRPALNLPSATDPSVPPATGAATPRRDS